MKMGIFCPVANDTVSLTPWWYSCVLDQVQLEFDTMREVSILRVEPLFAWYEGCQHVQQMMSS